MLHFYVRIFLFFSVACCLEPVHVDAQQSRKHAFSGQQIQNLIQQCENHNIPFFLNNKPSDTLYSLAKKGIVITPEDDYKNLSKFYYYLGTGYFLAHSNDFEYMDSISYAYRKSLAYAQRASSQEQIVEACTMLMHYYYETMETGKVDSFRTMLQSVVDSTDDKNILREGYVALADYYQNKSYYSNAQNYYLKAVPLVQAYADSVKTDKAKYSMANLCSMAAQLYLKINAPAEAIDMLGKARRYVNVSYPPSFYYSTFAEAFCQDKNIDSALFYLNRYVNHEEDSLREKKLSTNEVVEPNNAVIEYYLNNGHYDSAKFFLDTLHSLFAREVSESMYKYHSYNSKRLLGRYYFDTHNYSKAIDTLLSALPVASMQNREVEAGILKYLSLSYHELGNNNAAFNYSQRYVHLLDSLTAEKVSRNLADMQTLYRTNEKIQQITLLNKKEQLKTLQLKNASRLKWILFLVVLLLAIFSLMMYFFYRNKERMNRLLNKQNEALDNLNNQLTRANDTKAKLFGIIGHDLRSPVSNIIQLMRLKKKNPEITETGKAKEHEQKLGLALDNVLEEMENLLVWSKSQMEDFSPDITEVNIAGIVNKELQLLQSYINDKRLHIRQLLSNDFIKQTDENFITIVLRNLLLNAVKYTGDSGSITIEAQQENICITNAPTQNEAELLNEKLQHSTVSSKNSGFGLQIIHDIAASVNVRIYFIQTNNNSVSAIVSWPG